MARSNKSTTKKNSKSKIVISLILIVLFLVADFVITKLPQNSEADSTPRVSIVETLFHNLFELIDGSEVDSSDDDETFNTESGNSSSNVGNSNNSVNDTSNEGSIEYTDEQLIVYFFDVGQADCILLMLGDEVMLVDTGNAGDAQETGKLVKGNINITHELQRLGIEEIDILVATHPHEDHMGSMYKIINTFDVKSLYANALLEESERPNYYKRFVTALENSDVHFISPTTLTESEIMKKVEEYNAMLLDEEDEEIIELLVYNPDDYIRLGDTINFGSATVTMIAPSSAEYSDTNDYSIVLMVEFEGVKLLLTGDAGKEAEEEMIAFAKETGFELDCDILKVGHHGSRTANTEAFISAVSPEYAIVMVAEENSYGLPDEDVIERLENHNAVVYQTQDCGDIKLVIDNGSYKFDFSYTHEEKPED